MRHTVAEVVHHDVESRVLTRIDGICRGRLGDHQVGATDRNRRRGLRGDAIGGSGGRDVLFTAPQVAGVVGEEMLTAAVPPGFKLPIVQLNTPAAIVQPLGLEPVMLQLNPDSVGREIIGMPTPSAIPAPFLSTVIPKPIVSSALAVLLLGVLVTCNCGQSTVAVAPCVSVGALVALRYAVGDSAPQEVSPVGEIIPTVALAPVARLPKEHDSTCAPTLPVMSQVPRHRVGGRDSPVETSLIKTNQTT